MRRAPERPRRRALQRGAAASCGSPPASWCMCQLWYIQIKNTHTRCRACVSSCQCVQLLKTSDAWTRVPWGPGLIRENKKHLDGGHQNSLMMLSDAKKKKSQNIRNWRERRESHGKSSGGRCGSVLQPEKIILNMIKIAAMCWWYFFARLTHLNVRWFRFHSAASWDDTWGLLIKWILADRLSSADGKRE